MKKNKRSIGDRGEQIALDYLKKKKIDIIETNYRSLYGEIDIIGKQKNEIIFFEVKYRKSKDIEQGVNSITRMKKRRIVKTAVDYIQTHEEYEHLSKRFDAIIINDVNDNINILTLENFIMTDNILNGVFY